MAEQKKYRIKGEPISLDEMKQFLWGAATRLRGQIDAAGYKEYIFPLLFFKRISDVYDDSMASLHAREVKILLERRVRILSSESLMVLIGVTCVR